MLQIDAEYSDWQQFKLASSHFISEFLIVIAIFNLVIKKRSKPGLSVCIQLNNAFTSRMI
jgi:hypothetical protein